MELLTQGSWQAVGIALAGVLLIALIGHAMRDLWELIKQQPLAAFIGVLSLGAMGFALWQVFHAVDFLGPDEQPAHLVHVKYAILSAGLAALLFAGSVTTLAILVFKYARDVHEDLQRFKAYFATSTAIAPKKP
jgi:hypothetical protein